MDIAIRVSEMSYAQRKKVGCIVVKDGNILSMGWNGTPSGFDNTCEDVCEDGSLVTKKEVLHAELNCLAKMAKSTESSYGSTMYVTLSPCINCAKLMIQCGIKRVVYLEKYHNDEGIDFLKEMNVDVVHFDQAKPNDKNDNLIMDSFLSQFNNKKKIPDIFDKCKTWEELKVAIAGSIWSCIDTKIIIPDGYYESSLRKFTIVNGKFDGKYESWYDNGKPQIYTTYKDGEREGEFKRWYENGQLESHSFYKDGKLHGEYKKWHTNGQPHIDCTYKESKLHGEYKQWFDNGQLWENCFYEDGLLNGGLMQFYFYPKGKLAKYSLYKDGELVETFV